MRVFPLFIIIACIITGCATTLRQAVPPQLQDRAVVAGINSERIRVWGDQAPKDVEAYTKEFERQRRNAPLSAQERRTSNLLVISGGGADGAFGAGLLNGWSKSGTRPKFVIVTGVSTGALMAPFAFLGPAYDRQIKEIYTKYSTQDILRSRVLAGLLGGPSVSSSEPLAELIAKYVTKKLLHKIAVEHQKGRRLLVGTTNLDAQRAVIWNMGQIASLGTDKALKLFRKVLLASASIPGIFPPVLIDVNVNGKRLQELHVDGGTTDNAILLPVQINLRALDRQFLRKRKRKLYIIANTKLTPEWEGVKVSTADIARRSIATLIKQQTEGDILKIYDFAKANRMKFNLASVPAYFKEESKEPFDLNYMTKLYKVGVKLGRQGYNWQKVPPTQ